MLGQDLPWANGALSHCCQRVQLQEGTEAIAKMPGQFSNTGTSVPLAATNSRSLVSAIPGMCVNFLSRVSCFGCCV